MPVQAPFKQKAFKGTELLHVKMMPTATWGNKLRQFRFFLVKKAGRTKVGLQLIAEVSINIMHSIFTVSFYIPVYIYIHT